MAAVPLSFRWDKDFVARVDAARGAVPRSAFVRECVERVLGPEGVPGKISASAARRGGASDARARRGVGSETPAPRPATARARPSARPMVEQPRPIVGKRPKRS
jgi:hypothetical protein